MGTAIWKENEVARIPAHRACTTKYIYVRVSTPSQSVERQINDLKKICPEGIIVQDTYTGTTMNRPGWIKLMQKVEKKQVTDIYMEEISRMGRTREEGYKEWMRLNELGIHLHFSRQPQVNTDTYRKSVEQDVRIDLTSADKATKELMSAIIKGINEYRTEIAKQQIYNVFDEAQFERDMLAQRTSEGLLVAKLNGKRVGRQKGERIISELLGN